MRCPECGVEKPNERSLTMHMLSKHPGAASRHMGFPFTDKKGDNASPKKERAPAEAKPARPGEAWHGLPWD